MEEGNWVELLTQENDRRISELCKAKDVRSSWYKRWCEEIKEEPRPHRKQWEYAYILQALWERGCIESGKKGLAFAVGTEPLPSLLAKYGCHILATDIHPEKGSELGWTDGNQLCFGVEDLNKRQICDENIFRERVSYRPVDMNAIPNEIHDFDFNWSSCSFEHLGTIEQGLKFLKNQLKTLKPGGWAVHTTEFNLSSNDLTLDNNNTVIFRAMDIEKIVRELRDEGHFVEKLDYALGGLPEDYHVDLFPYAGNIHLRLQIDGYVATSIGLIIQKKKKKSWFR